MNAWTLGWERCGGRRKNLVTVPGKKGQEVERRQGKCLRDGEKIL